MKHLGLGFVATILLTIAGANQALAQSVHGSCVGSRDANGNFTSASAGGCDNTPPPDAASGPALSPLQQGQLDAAYGVGSAVGSAFVNWLLEPAPYSDPQSRQRAIQQARQHYLRGLDRREREGRQEQEEHAAVADSFKGLDSPPELASKDLGNAGSLSGEQERTFEGLKNQVHTVDCAMSDVYGAADKLGPEGQKFTEALNRDVLDLEAKLPAPPPQRGSDAYDVAALSRHLASEGAKTGLQIDVDALVSRNAETGRTTIIVSRSAQKTKAGLWTRLMHPLGGWRKAREGESVVLLDRDGKVLCQQLTPAAAACMKRYDPAYGAAEYCPNPPEEKHP